MFYLYDDALIRTLRSWTGDGKITVNKYELLFPYRADVASDKVQLPIISVSRASPKILNTNKTPLSVDGMKFVETDPRKRNDRPIKIPRLRAIPVRLHYQIDVITRNLEENDNIIRELVFKFINNPTLKVDIPYKGCELSHKFNLMLSEDIEDNSDITEHLNLGETYRQTLDLFTDDAYLFSYSTKDTLDIEVSQEIKKQGEN